MTLKGLGYWLGDAAWWLRHPTTTRCPRCRSTWESRWFMDRYLGGVCHDCHHDDLMRDVVDA